MFEAATVPGDDLQAFTHECRTMSAAWDHEPPLSRDEWKRLEPMLDALLDAPPERRGALLATLSAGDAELGARLERVVAECGRAYALLDRPAASRFASLLGDGDTAMPDALAARYRPIRELGRGGMAVVYLARDIRHDRDVAVKIVRAELAATLGRERFLREIAIVARLRHPHIVPLFDSGEVDGTLFYVMPYIEGHSLRDRLEQAPPLSVGQVLVILRDVCDALTHAHEHGVIHRDVKPDNVLLSGRHALVSDFGVARAVTAAAQEGTRTDAGVLLGTPTYMAPEQATGDPHVDHRADIYAFGVLAYEMLTGRPPFIGEKSQDVVAAHLVQQPQPLTELRPDVPAPLAELVMRCLAKRQADRWPSTDSMLAQLQAMAASTEAIDSGERAPTRYRRPSVRRATTIAGGFLTVLAGTWAVGELRSPAPATTSPALAVLVFRHDVQPELEQLALRVTSSLIGSLGSVGAIDVRSMDAVMPYRDGRTTHDVVARRLGVEWLVGGQVFHSGDSVTVIAELTDAGTGRARGRTTAAALRGREGALVDSVVAAVASMLRERIGEQVRLTAWRAGTRNAAAIDAVSRAYRTAQDATYLMQAGDMAEAFANLRRADSILQRAARAAPDWPEPHIQRAWIARRIAFSVFGTSNVTDSISSAISRGISSAETALRIAPTDARSREILGILLHARWMLVSATRTEATLDSAARVLTAATDADTSLARGLATLSLIHFERGQIEKARLVLARAYHADAYADDAPQILSRLFHYNFMDAADPEARRWCSIYARSRPEDWFGGACRLQLMAWDPAETPNISAAWGFAEVSESLAADTVRSATGAQLAMLVAAVIAKAGDADSARRVISRVQSYVQTNPGIVRGPFGGTLIELEAAVWVKLGETERATQLLTDYLAQNPARKPSLARDRRFRDLPIRALPDASAGRS